MGDFFFEQGDIENLFYIVYIVEFQPFEIVLFYVFDIFSVFFAENDLFDAGTLSPRIFSLIPPTGSTRPRSVISPVMAR